MTDSEEGAPEIREEDVVELPERETMTISADFTALVSDQQWMREVADYWDVPLNCVLRMVVEQGVLKLQRAFGDKPSMTIPREEVEETVREALDYLEIVEHNIEPKVRTAFDNARKKLRSLLDEGETDD